MSKQIRYFPFYIEEFLTAVDDFTADEIGGYLLLLIHQYRTGKIPGDLKSLKRISKVSFKKIEKILQKFEKKTDEKNCVFYQNLKVVEVQEEVLKLSKKRAKAANTRWGNTDANAYASGYANAYANAMQLNIKEDILEIKDNKRDYRHTDAHGNSHLQFSHKNFFTVQSFESFCENYLFSSHWEQVCMKIGIDTPQEQKKWLTEAKNDIIGSCEFETYSNEADAKRHIYYKIKNLIEKTKKNNEKSTIPASNGKIAKPNPTDRFRTNSEQPVLPFKPITGDDL